MYLCFHLTVSKSGADPKIIEILLKVALNTITLFSGNKIPQAKHAY
jgi:hypothetical protein